jgi:CHAT domain-containing protein
VRAQSRSGSVVHIAAPFRLNPASPLFSPVLLSAPIPADVPTDSAAPSVKSTASRDPDDDGAWELREIIGRQDFQARVVILSDGAALSMRDGAAAADVLQWAWLTAGVPSQLVARWHTPSPGRESLLGAFHARLQRGAAPAAALRDVLLAIRARGDVAPVHWAGWMLLGRDPDSASHRSSR